MGFPELGDQVPRRNHPRLQKLARGLLTRLGWGVEGTLPNLPKMLVIAAPHTSNWDFFLAMCILFGLPLDARWIAKHTIFRWPVGGLMRWLGGIPVDRRTHHGMVERGIDLFNDQPRLVLGITPEGTRKRVERWRTGFYHIATGAGVPVVPAYLDYPRRRVGFGEPFWPTGDIDADISALRQFYEPYRRSGVRADHY